VVGLKTKYEKLILLRVVSGPLMTATKIEFSKTCFDSIWTCTPLESEPKQKPFKNTLEIDLP
jgi:hypothetical protein